MTSVVRRVDCPDNSRSYNIKEEFKRMTSKEYRKALKPKGTKHIYWQYRGIIQRRDYYCVAYEMDLDRWYKCPPSWASEHSLNFPPKFYRCIARLRRRFLSLKSKLLKK